MALVAVRTPATGEAWEGNLDRLIEGCQPDEQACLRSGHPTAHLYRLRPDDTEHIYLVSTNRAEVNKTGKEPPYCVSVSSEAWRLILQFCLGG